MARVQKNNAVAPVTFVEAVKNYWRGFFRFNGVSSRREYWFAWIFCFVFNVVAHLCGAVVGAIAVAAMFLPSRALGFRRFQDVGLSGWWYLVPYCVLLVWSQLRMPAWAMFVEVEYMPWDLLMFMAFVVLWLLFLLYVYVQPSKVQNNKYRK